MIKVENISKQFKNRSVVKDVSLEINQGEVVGLLGPNGAGKTTTFYMIIGIEKPDNGKIFFFDENITFIPIYKRGLLGISYLPQDSSDFKSLSVIDNLIIFLELKKGLSRSEMVNIAEETLKEMGIFHVKDQRASTLSGGERRRLEIARALILKPSFLLLDEPFAGVDPLAIQDLQSIITMLREKGIGILISDHNVKETLKICDRAYILYNGSILEEGTPDTIAKSEKAKNLYLGKTFEN